VRHERTRRYIEIEETSASAFWFRNGDRTRSQRVLDGGAYTPGLQAERVSWDESDIGAHARKVRRAVASFMVRQPVPPGPEVFHAMRR
jgi:hypothetical protein